MKRCSCGDDGDETMTMMALVLGCVVVMICMWLNAGAARIAVRIAPLMSQSQSDQPIPNPACAVAEKAPGASCSAA